MKLCIYGGSGKLGQLLIEQASKLGHDIIAPVRAETDFNHPDARIIPTETLLENEPAMTDAIQGTDAVILALGTTDRNPNTVLSEGTQRIIKAMQQVGCTRLIVVTSFGCRESLPQVKPFLFRELVVKRLGKEIWKDKDRQENLVEESGLDYTIVRPTGLSEDPLTVDYQAVLAGEPLSPKGRIPRADVAHFVLQCLNDEATKGKIYTIIL